MSDVNCPYCEAQQDLSGHDFTGEDVLNEHECKNCKKTFQFTTGISYFYRANKSDCLNDGGEHVWKLSTRYQHIYAHLEKLVCIHCSEEKPNQGD
jgi:hypothetical protein